ncbi:anti-sigma factor family protein [Azospirillum sp. A39]|uniref:anti-sigma factor family protein n=1 Tax=Azospirillum sp. A39 TaxID=3462279 RepID=UPI00404528B8
MKRVTMSHINAYLDGALSEQERQEFEARVEDDADAKALLALHRQHVHELHRLYDPVLDEPVPERMLELLRRRKPSG